MKRETGEVYCDKCHLIIAPNAPDRLSYGKTDYHAACYLAYRKQTKPPRVQLDEVRLAFLIVAALWFAALFSPLDAEEIYAQSQWKLGRLVRAIDMDGRCVARPFVVVGETENDVDTDGARVIGFHSDNIVYDREKRIVWERLPAERFAPPNTVVGHLHGRACRFR
jgi:hypothetical protein